MGRYEMGCDEGCFEKHLLNASEEVVNALNSSVERHVKANFLWLDDPLLSMTIQL
jgi:hypothetical protein